MSRDHLSFNEFDVKKILCKKEHHPTVAVVAPRGSGKSYLIKDLVYHLRHKKVYCICAD